MAGVACCYRIATTQQSARSNAECLNLQMDGGYSSSCSLKHLLKPLLFMVIALTSWLAGSGHI